MKKRGLLLSLAMMVSNAVPSYSQSAADPFAVMALHARQAMIDGDLSNAENFWLAALQELRADATATRTFADPRYYYTERWLGVTMLLEKKAASAEGILAPACDKQGLSLSLLNEDVRATVDVYAQILRANGKPTAAKDVIDLWNSIASGSDKKAAMALSDTPSATSTLNGGMSSISSTLNAMSGTPGPFQTARAKDIPVPPPPPAAPM